MRHIFPLIIFFALLLTPGVLTLKKVMSGEEAVKNGVERRNLATVDKYLKSLKHDKMDTLSSLPELGEALKDQLVFRPEVTKAVNSRLIALGHSPSDKIVIGQKNYWFQTGAPDYRRIPCIRSNDVNLPAMKNMLESYRDFESRAAEKGVKVYAIIIPFTSSIYPENLPEPLRSKCADKEPPLQTLLENADYGNVFYDIDWFRQQEEGFVYDPRSFHWSKPGAQRYWEYFVNERLKDELPHVSFGDTRMIDAKIDNASDLGVAPLFEKQQSRALRHKPDVSTDWRERFGEDTLNDIIRPGGQRMVKITEGGKFDKTGILFGDSFTAMPWPYFSRHFENAYRFQSSFLKLNEGVMDKFLDEVETDYLFIMWTEAKWVVIEDDLVGTNVAFNAAPDEDN